MTIPEPGYSGIPRTHPDADYDYDTDESVEHLFDDDEFVDERAPSGARPGPAKSADAGSRTFLESISDTLKSAGETATRYTQLGVAHAELQKIRFDLRRAYGKLGEAVTRCWDHHPGIALSTHDPELKATLEAVRQARKQIRAKQADIAALKSK